MVERIKEAISKAKITRDTQKDKHTKGRMKAPKSTGQQHGTGHGDGLWAPPVVSVNTEHLKQQRIVSYAKNDASHVAFDILRTKIMQTLKENDWKSVAITSPTAGCGKTMVALNLAMSMSRQSDCRTVLVDLDLKRPSVARTLGIQSRQSIVQYIEGLAELDECFVSMNENLFLGLNNQSVNNSSEMIQHARAGLIPETVGHFLEPKVVIFDLPPMLTSDDAIAFLPQVDCVFLVAASGKTTTREIDECEIHLSEALNYLGIVLNKCEGLTEEYYQYDMT